METFEGQTNFIFHSALLGFYSILEKYNGFFEIRNVFKKNSNSSNDGSNINISRRRRSLL